MGVYGGVCDQPDHIKYINPQTQIFLVFSD